MGKYVGRFDGVAGVLLGGFLVNADHFGGLGGIQRFQLEADWSAFTGDQQIVFLAELRADFFKRRRMPWAFWRLGEIDIGLVRQTGRELGGRAWQLRTYVDVLDY